MQTLDPFQALETEIRDAIALLAELSTTSETPGIVRDDLFDELVYIARGIIIRDSK